MGPFLVAELNLASVFLLVDIAFAAIPVKGKTTLV